MELKSSSLKKKAFNKGLYSERKVFEDLFSKKKFICHRLRLSFAELDLVFYDLQNESLIIIEVKSLSEKGFEECRISQMQIRRLLKAQIFLIEELDCPVELRVAFVRDDGRVTYLNDFII